MDFRFFIADDSGLPTQNHIGKKLTIASGLIIGKWHHIVGTYDGVGTTAAAVKLYVDGALVGVDHTVGAAFSAWNNSNESVRIGNQFTSGVAAGHHDGRIDEVATWNKELSAAEVTELFRLTNVVVGRPGDLLRHSAVANIVNWWRMGEGILFPGPMFNEIPNGNNGILNNMVFSDITGDCA